MNEPVALNDHSSVARGKAANLDRILTRYAGAYSDNTLRGYAADLRCFQDWCEGSQLAWLPSAAETVAAFIDNQAVRLSISTLKRRIAAIKFAHRYSDLPDPTHASCLLLATRRAARQKLARPDQAKGLTSELLKRITEHCPTTPADLRDAALISVGYDTLCRSSELLKMCVEHLRIGRDGNWSILVPRSKGDQVGEGRVAWLSPDTTAALKRWLAKANIETGPLFRSLHLGRLTPNPIAETSSIRRLAKRAALRAGVEPTIARGVGAFHARRRRTGHAACGVRQRRNHAGRWLAITQRVATLRRKRIRPDSSSETMAHPHLSATSKELEIKNSHCNMVYTLFVPDRALYTKARTQARAIE